MKAQNQNEFEIDSALLDQYVEYLNTHYFRTVNEKDTVLIRKSNLQQVSYHGASLLWYGFTQNRKLDHLAKAYTEHAFNQVRGFAGVGWQPNAEYQSAIKLPCNNLLYNTYKQYKPSNSGGDCYLFIELMERLFPVDKERHLITQWLAHMIQHPNDRPSWHVLVLSDTGTGKSFLYSEVIKPLLMNQSANITRISQLTGKHSTVVKDNLFICLEDVDPRYNAQDQLLSWLSEPYALIEEKGKQQRTISNYTRVWLNCNPPLKMRLKPSERRWFVPRFIEHKTSRQETQRFIESVANWLNDPEAPTRPLDAIYNYLATYPLEGFNPKHVEQSEHLLELINNNCSPLHDEVTEFLQTHLFFKYNELKEHLSNIGYQFNDNEVSLILVEKDYRKQVIRDPTTGKQFRIWMKDSASTAQVLAVYGDKPSGNVVHYPF
ncbi:primase-helicase family protein [Nitrincola alkalilacustris]|uniref:primase-helicase family protein n=1 Tax=Nitrincola alkalilacustris TaxID=1571224 RepID=UPI00124BD924|nr:primase-helicase family protein [Nitrincola alkalilacustris]